MMIKLTEDQKQRLIVISADHAHQIITSGGAHIDELAQQAERVLYDAFKAERDDAFRYLARYTEECGGNSPLSEMACNLYTELGLENKFIRQFDWAIKEARENNHGVLDILPVEQHQWTCSLKCQADENREIYYIHLDDGDLHITQDPGWGLPSETHNTHSFYTIPPYRTLLLLQGLESI